MFQKIKKFFKDIQMTPEERYLAASYDLVDLEGRLKELRRKGIWV